MAFDTSAGGEGGLGAKLGIPADESGVSQIIPLLSDAINGTCFYIEIYFKAFSPMELQTLAMEGYTGYADERINATFPTRFCARNARTISIVQQPSTAVQLDGDLPQHPIVSIETPLIPLALDRAVLDAMVANATSEAGSGEAAVVDAPGVPTTPPSHDALPQLYYLADGVTDLLSFQMLPETVGGTSLPVHRRGYYGQRMLSANKCMMYGGMLLSGRCSNVPPDSSVTGVAAIQMTTNEPMPQGVVVGGVAAYSSAASAAVAAVERVGHRAMFGSLLDADPNVASYLPPLPIFISPRASLSDDAPKWVERYQFDALKWVQSLPSLGTTMSLIGTTETSLLGSPSGSTDEMTVEETPSSVAITSIPPRHIKVNEPFLLTAIVRISSGAPLRGTRVTVETAPVSGASTSPFAFLQSLIGAQTVDASSEPPTLQARSASAFTDDNGVARFVLRFATGPLTASTALVLRAGSVTSSRTAAISVHNDVYQVNATNVSYSRTGLDGIGNPNTREVQLLQLPPESFPTTCDLLSQSAEPLRVSVTLRLEETADGSGAAPLSNVSLLRTYLRFRVFDKEQIDRLRAQERAIERAVANISLAAQQLMPSAFAATRSAVKSTIEVGSQLAEEAAMAASGMGATGDSAFTDMTGASQLVENAILASLSPSSAADAAAATPALLMQFVTLLMGGTMPSSASPQGPSSSKAAVEPLDLLDTAIESYDPSSGVAVVAVSRLRLEVRQPGTFYLQPIVSGVAGVVGGEIVIERYNSQTPQAVLLQMVFRFAMCAFIALMVLGNSAWHSPVLTVPFSFCVIIGVGGAIVEQYRMSNAFGGPESIGTWWLVTLVGILVFTLHGLLCSVPGLNTCFLFRSFPERRRAAYFNYVKRFMTEEHKKESYKLRKRIEKFDEEFLRRVSVEPRSASATVGSPPPSPPEQSEPTAASTLSKMTSSVSERLYAEERLNRIILEERSIIKNLVAIVKGFFREDPAAFYLPVRFACAFVISLFSITFMAITFATTMANFRRTVISADVSTRLAVYSSIASLQTGFLTATGVDLPSVCSNWLLSNAERIHEYMISLADAILIASIVGSALALTIYAIITCIMIADFRIQAIQARRGIWQFDEAKVAIKLTTTFIGTQISNALLIYLLFAFIFTTVTFILAWRLTWDVIVFVLVTYWREILVLVGLAVINPIIKLVVSQAAIAKKFIKMRYVWAFFEMWELFLQVAIGVTKSISRFVLVIVGVLFSLPRIDRSPFPAWIEYYLLLDSGSKSYQGMICMYHAHNHPIMRVAAWLMLEDSRDRRDEERRAARGLALPKVRRCSNRWQKTVFLLRNPKLVKFSTGAQKVIGLDGFDKKAIVKLAKKGVGARDADGIPDDLHEKVAKEKLEVQKGENVDVKQKAAPRPSAPPAAVPSPAATTSSTTTEKI